MIVVTGRMVQSVRRFLEPAGLGEPVDLLPGRASSPTPTGEWLRHEPIPLELAKEAARRASKAEGYGPNVYVDDELYVSRADGGGARLRRASSTSEIHDVGDTLRRG